MKPVRIILLILVLTFISCSEGGAASRTQGSTVTVNDVLAAEMEKTDAASSSAPAPVEATESTPAPVIAVEPSPAPVETPDPSPAEAAAARTYAPEEIDVDLTAMSGTMVYSEVYGMMTAPEDYLGKVVKMQGQFSHYYDKKLDQHYYLCFIADATACCAQGMEFIPAADLVYPDQFPAVDDPITVVGVFDLYWEGEIEYCTLRNAVILP